jgi:hypothetical protein
MRISDRVRATRSLCGPTLVVMAGDATIGVSLVDCAMAIGIVTAVLVTVVLALEVVGVTTGATVVVVVCTTATDTGATVVVVVGMGARVVVVVVVVGATVVGATVVGATVVVGTGISAGAAFTPVSPTRFLMRNASHSFTG